MIERKAGEDQHGTCRGQQIAAKASGKDVERRARDPNLTDNLGVFVLCLQPHSNAIPTRLSAPQHSRKFAAVGEGAVAMETDACCSSPPPRPHSLLLTFPPRAVGCTAHFTTVFAQRLTMSAVSVGQKNKPFNNLS